MLDTWLSRTGWRQAILGTALLISVAAGGLVLAACDNGTAAPAATTPATGSSVGDVTRGAEVFSRYCNACHPGGGQGAGPSLIAEGPRLSDGRIRNTVRGGRGRMPAFSASQISDDDLTSLIAYIRTLK